MFKYSLSPSLPPSLSLSLSHTHTHKHMRAHTTLWRHFQYHYDLPYVSVSVCAEFSGNPIQLLARESQLRVTSCSWGHLRFCGITSGTTMVSPTCQYQSVRSLVTIRQLPCKLDSLAVLGYHFRFYDVTSGNTLASPMCQYRSVLSLVTIGQLPCPGEPNNSHFRFYEVTSGSVTLLPVPLWRPLCVSFGLCQA